MLDIPYRAHVSSKPENSSLLLIARSRARIAHAKKLIERSQVRLDRWHDRCLERAGLLTAAPAPSAK